MIGVCQELIIVFSKKSIKIAFVKRSHGFDFGKKPDL